MKKTVQAPMFLLAVLTGTFQTLSPLRLVKLLRVGKLQGTRAWGSGHEFCFEIILRVIYTPYTPCMEYMPALNTQTTPTDRHIWHTWSVRVLVLVNYQCLLGNNSASPPEGVNNLFQMRSKNSLSASRPSHLQSPIFAANPGQPHVLKQSGCKHIWDWHIQHWGG